MDSLIFLNEAWRLFKRRQPFKSFNRFKGNHREICKEIIKGCFNGEYLQTSLGHFSQFYVRDFAFSVKALINLGYADEVKKTILYALSVFEKEGRVSTTITPEGRCVDIFRFGTDSLPLLLYSIKVSKFDVSDYKDFLNEKIKEYVSLVVDRKSGLVKKGRFFSTIKDSSVRSSDCYSNCMLFLLQKMCGELGLLNPLSGIDYFKFIMDNFFEYDHFKDDVDNDVISADANVFPFWVGLVPVEHFKLVNNTIEREGLTSPFPIKYTKKNVYRHQMLTRLLTPNYLGNTVWGHLGMVYLDVLSRIDKKKTKMYLRKYRDQIRKYGTFLEVYNKDGTPYKSFFYMCDEAMIWSGVYLDLVERLF